MKLFKIILLALITFVVAYAAAPSAWSLQSAAPSWGFDGTITVSDEAGFDTLVSTDSVALWTNLSPKRGYFYSIVRDAITGTGADSVALVVRIDCKDSKNNILYSTVIDTMVSSVGEPIAIDFGGALKGNYFDVTLVGTSENGSQVIVNRVYMDQTRPVSYPKMWR